MKNKFGWFLTTLAIMTFTFGQGSAAAVQIATAQAAAAPAAVVSAAAAPAAAAPAAVAPAAVAPAAVAPAAVVSNAPVSPTDQTKVPHYFGPYSNWTNSPQVLSDAVVSLSPPAAAGGAVSVGNPLVSRAFATDTNPTAGTLAPYFVVLPNAKLPTGSLQSFQYWNQGNAGALFHAYVLRPTPGVANGYTVIYDSGVQTVPAPTVGTGEVATVPVSPSVAVAVGDVIGFYGNGIPVDINVGTDTLSFPAPVAPALNSTMTLGVTSGFPIYPQNRTYSFGATVAPALTVSVGNPLVSRAFATDSIPAPGTLAPYFVVLPNAKLPTGSLQSFQYWNQGNAGALFHAYVLRPTPGVANGYTVIYDSGLQTVPAPTVGTGEVATVPVTPSVAVAVGDVIGFYGNGIPVDINVGTDTLIYPAHVAPTLNQTMTLGVDPAFPIYLQARTYSFAATVTPSG
jgi:hypothetical protein